MKIKRIKSLRINAYTFKIVWDANIYGGSFDYVDRTITIGTKIEDETVILSNIIHELYEMTAVEMNVRLTIPDSDNDYIFVYDHRQFSTMNEIFTGLLSQFLTD